MSYPHDYYHMDDPHLHNRGENRPYLEPDWHANCHDAQLPALSAIGRGPRGEGLYVDNVVQEDGLLTFGLYSTLTKELVWQSPNLSAPKISFEIPDWRDTTAGVPMPINIVVQQGEHVDVTPAYVPAGAQGSIMFIKNDLVNRNSSDTYQAPIGDLVISPNGNFEHMPTPRVNDTVIFQYQDDGGVGFAFGNIVAVENGYAVFIARVYIPTYFMIWEEHLSEIHRQIQDLQEQIEDLENQIPRQEQ